jgi:hypothetical protein
VDYNQLGTPIDGGRYVWLITLWRYVLKFNLTIALEETTYFRFVSTTKFSCKWHLQLKIPLVTFDKSHVVLLTNNKGIGWTKNQQIQVHPLIPLYMYFHMWLQCDYFGHYWKAKYVPPRVPILNYLK